MGKELELTILMPCLNEAETLAACIRKSKSFMREQHINGEVLVADNGSSDNSREIAVQEGARLISVEKRGYGSALMGGIEAASGEYIIMGDADDSYDFTSIMPFVEKLREGYDLVMGNRFKGGIAKGAMPPLHRYLGNPILSGMGRLFFGSNINDFHCGLRGFSKKAILSLNLNTVGMEFASEMVVKALMHKLKVTEVPTALSRDGRSRPPHLRSWSDGWRHLKFLLMFSPRWLFFYPGLVLIVLGSLGTGILTFTPVKINNVSLDVHTMLYCVLMVILGVQTVSFSIITGAYARIVKLYPANDKFLERIYSFPVEKGVIAGVILFIAGLALSVAGVSIWVKTGFGKLMPASMLRLLLPAVLTLSIGWQIIFTSFLIGIFQIKTRAQR
jgi:glycosyltransferase involved in cell wall biosynthesis